MIQDQSTVTVRGYGKVAIDAVEIIINSSQGNGSHKCPKEAWNDAAEVVFDSKSSREKVCPKAAFLGLCEEDLVKGVPRGRYTSSKLNKKYALCGLDLLRKRTKNKKVTDQPNAKLSSTELWGEVCKELRIEGKQHNGQMNVVIALFYEGKLEDRDPDLPCIRNSAVADIVS